MHRASSGWSLALILAFAAPWAEAAQTRAFVVTTDFVTGGLSVIDLATRAVTPDVASVHSDATLRWYQGKIYVVNRFGQDNIQVIDPAQNYATVRQFSTGNGSNPHDIAFVSPTKAYVTRYGLADLLIVNPATGAGLGVIPLGGFADGDGIPEMDRMFRVDRYVFVALERLTNFAPSNPSLVAVIDTEADTVVDVNPALPGKQAIALVGRNPATTFAYDRESGRLLVGCAGAYGALDGGVELVNPSSFQSEGYAITEAALGGDVLDLVWNGALHSYAIVSDAGFNTALVSWSAASGARLGTVYSPGGFSLADADLNDRGEIYVCNSSFAGPGVFVFRAGPDDLIAGPLDTGLPSYQVTFDQATDEAVGVAPRPPDVAFSAPWPNPSRTAASFRLRLERASTVKVEVFDLGGRKLRTLAAGDRGAGDAGLDWDLADDRGRALASGVYVVRAQVGGRVACQRVVVTR